MRPASSSGWSAFTIRKRSTSSASAAAVGKNSTGVPNSPQRVTVTSWPRRCENHAVLSLGMQGSRRAGRGILCAARGRDKQPADEPAEEPAASRRGRLRPRRRALGRVLLAPLLDLLPEVLGEGLVLVLREERRDLALDGFARARGAEELPGHLVEVREVLVAELPEAVGLEALVRDGGVGRELVALRHVLVRDREER